MFLSLLIWILLISEGLWGGLLGGLFHSCVMEAPPERAQTDPSLIPRQFDRIWEALSQHLIAQTQSHHHQIQSDLLAATHTLPPGSYDVPETHDDEIRTLGTYGRLPEVLVDLGQGAIFPVPVHAPSRYSWFQTSLDARVALDSLHRFELGLANWRRLDPIERGHRFNELTSVWEAVDAQVINLAHEARYLSTWVPQLGRQWIDANRTGSIPAQYVLTRSMQSNEIWDWMHEALRPRRIMKRTFLPEQLPQQSGAVILLPIATDVKNQRFLTEVEGALDTHWNQSAWARDHGIRFKIHWKSIPVDSQFAAGKLSLDQHLGQFPKDRAAMTTGGLTTYVRGQALVLGPGKINPRTLAHELGHLLGFADCYLRTLSSQGVFGTAVLEWDNPLYPDDLMCDNSVGAARAEAW